MGGWEFECREAWRRSGWMNGQMGGERVGEGEMDGFKWMKIEKYEMVGLLPIRIVKSNVLRVGPLSERNNISE